MRKSFVLELHGEWSEFADEYIGLLWPIDLQLSYRLAAE